MAEWGWFVSYSREQLHFTEIIVSYLQGNGIPVWFDLQQLTPGRPWRDGIEAGLQECSGLILVASRSSLASPYVQHEWESVQAARKPIVVVWAEPCTLPENLHPVASLDLSADFYTNSSKLLKTVWEGQHLQEAAPRQTQWGRWVKLPNGVRAVRNYLDTHLAALAVMGLLCLISLILDPRAALENLAYVLPLMGVTVFVWAVRWRFMTHQVLYARLRQARWLLPFAWLIAIWMPSLAFISDGLPKTGLGYNPTQEDWIALVTIIGLPFFMLRSMSWAKLNIKILFYLIVLAWLVMGSVLSTHGQGLPYGRWESWLFFIAFFLPLVMTIWPFLVGNFGLKSTDVFQWLSKGSFSAYDRQQFLGNFQKLVSMGWFFAYNRHQFLENVQRLVRQQQPKIAGAACKVAILGGSREARSRLYQILTAYGHQPPVELNKANAVLLVLDSQTDEEDVNLACANSGLMIPILWNNLDVATRFPKLLDYQIVDYRAREIGLLEEVGRYLAGDTSNNLALMTMPERFDRQVWAGLGNWLARLVGNGRVENSLGIAAILIVVTGLWIVTESSPDASPPDQTPVETIFAANTALSNRQTQQMQIMNMISTNVFAATAAATPRAVLSTATAEAVATPHP